MPNQQDLRTVSLEYDVVAPPAYQSIEIVGPLNEAAEQMIAQQLHFCLLSVPSNSGLQLSRATVNALADLITDTPGLRIYRTCIRWTVHDPNFEDQAEVRDRNNLVAWFIIRLLQGRSPKLGAHLVNDGFVNCRVFPDRLQFWFPNFKYE